MAEHVLQFDDGGADWCIHCGAFDLYLDGECEAERTGRFDASQPANFLRVYVSLFGDVAELEARLAYLEPLWAATEAVINDELLSEIRERAQESEKKQH